MEQYILKSVLVAEIERLRKSFKVISVASPSRDTTLENIAKAALCRQILSFLDTLEVKDVDLNKEVIDWWNAHYSSKAYTFEGYTGHYLENSTVIDIAKHFFELGLKAQKGE